MTPWTLTFIWTLLDGPDWAAHRGQEWLSTHNCYLRLCRTRAQQNRIPWP